MTGAGRNWTWEEHQLSEGYSCIVYDEHGQMVADHLSRDDAAKIASVHDLYEALQGMWDTSCTNATSTPSRAAFLKANAALAKATGK